MGRRGFMMAEVIVVSSVVLIVLTTLYVSYNKIFSFYQTRLNYEDSNLIYALAYYKDYLNETGTFRMATAMERLDMNGDYCSKLTANGGPLASIRVENNQLFDELKHLEDVVYLVHVAGNPLDPKKLGTADTGFLEYAEYLSGTNLLNINGVAASYILLLIRKDLDTHESKYAYLVVG